MPVDRTILLKSLNAVDDEKTFIKFLISLSNDRKASVASELSKPGSPYGPDAGGWENTTLEGFFDASISWAHDSENGNKFHTLPNNPWRRCADILFAGIIYE